MNFSRTAYGCLIFFVATTIYFGLSTRLFSYDFFWHLSAGGEILRQGAIISSDPFSYTAGGQPWVAHEWLFEVLLYLVYDNLGEAWVFYLVSLLSATSLYVAFTTANKLLDRPFLNLALTVAFGGPLIFLSLARPQLVSYLFFAIYLSVLLRAKYFRDLRYLVILPVVMVPWVNFHGGYLIGCVLVALFAGAETVQYLLRTDRREGEDEGDRRYCRLLVAYTAATFLASVVNPDLYERWLFPFEVMSLEATQYINEWKSFNFGDSVGKWYLLTCISLYLLMVYRKSKPDLTEVLIPTVFIIGGFVSLRHSPFASLAAIPFVAICVRDGCFDGLGKIWRAKAPFLARLKPDRTSGAAAGTTIQHCLLNWLVMAAVFGGYFPKILDVETFVSRRSERFPVHAVDYVVNNDLKGRMFNVYRFGGYLIHRLHPKQKVFIDGRADLYGDDFFKQYIEITEGGDKAFELIEKYKIDYFVILSKGSLYLQLLRDARFKPVHKDPLAAVFVRNTP